MMSLNGADLALIWYLNCMTRVTKYHAVEYTVPASVIIWLATESYAV